MVSGLKELLNILVSFILLSKNFVHFRSFLPGSYKQCEAEQKKFARINLDEQRNKEKANESTLFLYDLF